MTATAAKTEFAETIAAIKALTTEQTVVYNAINAALYAEPYFSDVQGSDIASVTGMTAQQVGGYVKALIDAGLVYVEYTDVNMSKRQFIHTHAHDAGLVRAGRIVHPASSENDYPTEEPAQPALDWQKVAQGHAAAMAGEGQVHVEYSDDAPHGSHWMLYLTDKHGIIVNDFDGYATMHDGMGMAECLWAQGDLKPEGDDEPPVPDDDYTHDPAGNDVPVAPAPKDSVAQYADHLAGEAEAASAALRKALWDKGHQLSVAIEQGDLYRAAWLARAIEEAITDKATAAAYGYAIEGDVLTGQRLVKKEES